MTASSCIRSAEAASIQAPLLLHYAGLDERINAGWDAYRAALEANGKTFTAFFFPVGDDLTRVASDYVAFLRDGLHFGPDDPLFPSTQVGHGEHRDFQAIGLAREPWATTEPIRRIFREAFTNAGLPYVNPHSFRKTLARLGQRLCKTPESWKAWTQNMGHESETTTFVGYGQVSSHRQAEILSGLVVDRSGRPLAKIEIEAIEALLRRVQQGSA